MARVRDERLCWLAVRDQLDRRSRRRSLLGRLVGNFTPTGRGLGVDLTRGSVKGRMMRYSFAVEDVAQRLTPEERQVLRSTGQVPDWFLNAVERRFHELRRRPRRDATP
ncbi:hypothetical protein GCM10023322_26740 [Rugosimonospora acidiphila]|uniref:Uncharacterized protein n=1 Tax=Rugosimonospora acidiphila TaxID=556531 RepID=A0ABP9RS67_9ACTN